MAKEKKPKPEIKHIKKDVLMLAAPKIMTAVELGKLPLSEMIKQRDAQEDYSRRYQTVLSDKDTSDLLKRITQGDIKQCYPIRIQAICSRGLLKAISSQKQKNKPMQLARANHILRLVISLLRRDVCAGSQGLAL
jgi:hypothetical protein